MDPSEVAVFMFTSAGALGAVRMSPNTTPEPTVGVPCDQLPLSPMLPPPFMFHLLTGEALSTRVRRKLSTVEAPMGPFMLYPTKLIFGTSGNVSVRSTPLLLKSTVQTQSTCE